MNNADYWKQRFTQLETAHHRKGATAYLEMERQYKEAQRQLEGQIARWYQRFADNNGISLAQAKQWLKGDDLAEFKWDVKAYIQHGKENAINGAWMQELENASAKYHISKLEALKIQTQNSLETMFAKQFGTMKKTLSDVYATGYYHTAYEVQRGFRIGWDIAGLDQAQIEKVLAKPWAVDGYNFSERIWGNKTKLISEVHNELSQNIMLGADPQKAIDSLAKKMNTSKNNAGRLVMTEEAYFSSAAQKDCFKSLDVEQYEIVATLDSHTSDICRNLDGKHFPTKDHQPGVTAPPFHVGCRSTTVPYFDEQFDIGERAARGTDGKTYYVPADMTYKEWEKQYVDNFVAVDQTQKITKKENSNDYSVDRKIVNSKKFHDKFEKLTKHKLMNESAYRESMKILEHRDGTDLEDVVVFNAKTGDIIVKNTSSVTPGRTGLTYEQYKIYRESSERKILLHNHPNGGRLSFTDLKTLFMNDDLDATIAVGHNGSIYIVSNPNRTVDIEKLYEMFYNEYKEIYANSELAKVYALDDLYGLKIFDYENR